MYNILIFCIIFINYYILFNNTEKNNEKIARVSSHLLLLIQLFVLISNNLLFDICRFNNFFDFLNFIQCYLPSIASIIILIISISTDSKKDIGTRFCIMCGNILYDDNENNICEECNKKIKLINSSKISETIKEKLQKNIDILSEKEIYKILDELKNKEDFKEKCNYCGAEINPEWKYCKKCGKEQNLFYINNKLKDEIKNNTIDKNNLDENAIVNYYLNTKILEKNVKKVDKKTIKNIVIIIILILVAIYSIFFYEINTEVVKDSCVMIYTYDENGNALYTGSGFCIFEPNIIVTNYHVIEDGYSTKVIDDNNNEYEITDILLTNPKNDLAILKGNFKFKPINYKKNPILNAGDIVRVIGSPKGELNTVSSGIVSNNDDEYQIRVTAPISPGSSGGVLLNNRNIAIGVIYATNYDKNSQNLNYAINIKYLEQLYDDYKNSNNIKFITYQNLAEYITPLNSEYNYDGSNLKDGTNYIFSPESTLYTISDVKKRFEFALNNGKNDPTIKGLLDIYNGMSENEKNIVTNKLDNIYSYDYEYGKIAENYDNLTIRELLIESHSTEGYELAMVLAKFNKARTLETQKETISKFPFSDGKKLFILRILGDFYTSDFSQNETKILKDYIYDLPIEDNEKQVIIEKTGLK